MAFSHQQGNDYLKFTSNSPCFFKIILLDTINSGKLEIPRKFVKEHGNSMSSPVVLRVPSGEVWKVEVAKCDGQTWLEKGWLEFSNHHSLDYGHLLVFRYDGNCSFHVNIFDKSATEIQYPHTSNNGQPCHEIPDQIIDISEDEYVNILDDMSPSRKTREKSRSPSPQTRNMKRSTDSAIKTETECNENHEFLDQQGCSCRSRLIIYQGQHANGHPVVRPVKRKPPSNASWLCLRPRKITTSAKSGCPSQIDRCNENDKALERDGNSVKSENSSFLIGMQPSHLGQDHCKNYRLGIPRNFAQKHITKEHSSVILCSSGKTWTVYISQVHVGNKLYSFLQTGWRIFVRDNGIQLGDVCSFELMNSIELSFKVVIQKGQHEKSCHQSASTDVFHRVKGNAQPCATSCPSCPEPLTDLKGARGFQVADASESENPFFSVKLQPSYANYNRLMIPVHFARKYLKNMHMKVILLRSNGKSWPVVYYQHCVAGPKPFIKFSNGWSRFSADNNLEVGDVCRFELTKAAETSMNVTITRKQAVEDAKLGSSSGDESREKQGEFHETASMKVKEDMFTRENNGEATGDFDDISAVKYQFSRKGLRIRKPNLETIIIE